MDRRQFLVAISFAPALAVCDTKPAVCPVNGPPPDGQWEFDMRDEFMNISDADRVSICVLDASGSKLGGCIAADSKTGYALAYQMVETGPKSSRVQHHLIEDCDLHHLPGWRYVKDREAGVCLPLRLHKNITISRT